MSGRGRPITIVGGSIGCLAAALVLAERGRSVRLYLQSGRAGGSFAGLRWQGRMLDLGVRLFELDYEDPPETRRTLGEFDPDRDNHRPFIEAVAGFIRQLIGDELEPVEPEMWVAGRRGRCLHFTTDLSGLPALLDRRERARMREEVATIIADPNPPPWRFLPGRPAALDEADLATASIANHGQLFHELLLRHHCERQTEAWEDTIAAERRKLWVALFHPATLAEALEGRPISFRPRRPFHRVRRGGAGLLVERLTDTLRAHPLVDIVPVGRLTRFAPHAGAAILDFAEAADAAPVRIKIDEGASVLGLVGDELFAASGIAFALDRVRSGIAWVEIPDSDILYWPALLSIHDPAIPALRISTGGGAATGWRLATIETGCEAPEPGRLRASLEALGAVRTGAPMRLLTSFYGPAQMSPSFRNRARFGAARAAFERLGWRGKVFGPARRFGFESLNDAIVEALHYAEGQC